MEKTIINASEGHATRVTKGARIRITTQKARRQPISLPTMLKLSVNGFRRCILGC